MHYRPDHSANEELREARAVRLCAQSLLGSTIRNGTPLSLCYCVTVYCTIVPPCCPPTRVSSPLFDRLVFGSYKWTQSTRLSTQRPQNFGVLACRSFIFDRGHTLIPEQRTIMGTHLASYGPYTSQRPRRRTRS